MSRRRSRWLTLILLGAWVLLGPVGMAFESCAAMMLLCDGGPCGVVSAIAAAAPSFSPPTALSIAVVQYPEHPTMVVRSGLEPPPKLVRLSA